MKKYYTLTVKTLAPVHIASGKKINKLEYVYSKPDSAKLKIHPLRKMPKIWYNKGIRIAEKQHQKGEEENAENRDSNKR